MSAIDFIERYEASDHADAIYYADLFIIRGKAWMIGGNGRSRAAELASGGDPAADIARDAVALIRQGAMLLGRHDPGALPKDSVQRHRLHRPLKLDAIAWCMSERETELAFAGRTIDIVPVDDRLIGAMLANTLYPAEWAPFYFDRQALASLVDPKRRLLRFLELTAGAVGTRFLVVPWMPSVEARAALYRDCRLSTG